jgi:hypothetical protein
LSRSIAKKQDTQGTPSPKRKGERGVYGPFSISSEASMLAIISENPCIKDCIGFAPLTAHPASPLGLVD